MFIYSIIYMHIKINIYAYVLSNLNIFHFIYIKNMYIIPTYLIISFIYQKEKKKLLHHSINSVMRNKIDKKRFLFRILRGVYIMGK